MCLAPTQSSLCLKNFLRACSGFICLSYFYFIFLFSPAPIDHAEVSTHRWWRWPAGQWWVEWQVVTRQIKHRSLLRCSGQQWSSEHLPEKKKTKDRISIGGYKTLAAVWEKKRLKAALTYLSSCAFVIQRAKGDSRQQNGDVEENSRGGVLQQTAIFPSYT